MKRVFTLVVLVLLVPAVQALIIEIDSETSTPTTTSFMLELGQEYLVEASGTYICNDAHNLGADAEWHQHIIEKYWMEYYYQTQVPEYLDLLVNETGYDWLGCEDAIITGSSIFSIHTYSPTHIYRLNIIGAGELAELRIYDSNYQDNSGSLTVEITEIPEPATLLLLGLGAVMLRRKK